MAEQLRLMAVHAHPDDESSKGAATMAKYVAEGAEVLVVTCTGRRARQRAQPAAQGRSGYRCATSPRSAVPRWSAPRRSSGSTTPGSGFVDSGLPEGDPLPPLPDGCFALEPVEVPPRRWSG